MRISVALISEVVAEWRGVPSRDIASDRRDKPAAQARHEVCFLARRLTRYSTPDIGRHMGGRDHTTVLHGVKKIADLVIANDGYAAELAAMSEAVSEAAHRLDAIEIAGPEDIDALAVAGKVMGGRHISLTVSADEVRALAMAVRSLNAAARPKPAKKPEPAPPDTGELVAAALAWAAANTANEQARFTADERDAEARLKREAAALAAAAAKFEEDQKKEPNDDPDRHEQRRAG